MRAMTIAAGALGVLLLVLPAMAQSTQEPQGPGPDPARKAEAAKLAADPALSAAANAAFLANNLKQPGVMKRPSGLQYKIIQNGFGSNFRLRSNLNLNWQYGDFGVTWGTRYYSGTKERCYYDEECSEPNYGSPDTTHDYAMNYRGATTFHDVQVSWNAPWNARIAIGANNVFDHYGPQMYSAPNSQYSYYGGYDIGRFIYMQYKQQF